MLWKPGTLVAVLPGCAMKVLGAEPGACPCLWAAFWPPVVTGEALPAAGPGVSLGLLAAPCSEWEQAGRIHPGKVTHINGAA